MTARVRFSPAAGADLSGIWDWTESRWGRTQAERHVLAIREACADLASGRRRGRSAEEVRAGYRKLAVGSHLLFFRVGEDGAIEVIRILHQRMDAAARLGGKGRGERAAHRDAPDKT